MKTNYLKIGALSLMMMAGATINAQQRTGDIGKTEDKSQSSVENGTIRVIDNKGTKKFLQVKNGLTLLTDVTPAGGIVSTWQLGGELASNTYIDATGDVFSLDGLKLVAPATLAATASTNASVGTNAVALGSNGTAAPVTDTGWTVLIRDEASGEIKKILASSLVKGGTASHTIVVAEQTANKYIHTNVGISATPAKLWVYRNGAKLVADVDYKITAGGVVTIEPTTGTPNDWAIYTGDFIEFQWIN